MHSNSTALKLTAAPLLSLVFLVGCSANEPEAIDFTLPSMTAEEKAVLIESFGTHPSISSDIYAQGVIVGEGSAVCSDRLVSAIPDKLVNYVNVTSSLLVKSPGVGCEVPFGAYRCIINTDEPVYFIKDNHVRRIQRLASTDTEVVELHFSANDAICRSVKSSAG